MTILGLVLNPYSTPHSDMCKMAGKHNRCSHYSEMKPRHPRSFRTYCARYTEMKISDGNHDGRNRIFPIHARCETYERWMWLDAGTMRKGSNRTKATMPVLHVTHEYIAHRGARHNSPYRKG